MQCDHNFNCLTPQNWFSKSFEAKIISCHFCNEFAIHPLAGDSPPLVCNCNFKRPVLTLNWTTLAGSNEFFFFFFFLRDFKKVMSLFCIPLIWLLIPKSAVRCHLLFLIISNALIFHEC